MSNNLQSGITESLKSDEIIHNKKSSRKHYFDGVKDALPLMLGCFPYALTFGVLAKTSGLSVLEATLMSALVLAGAAQYTAISLIVTGAGALPIIFATLLVNIRYILYSTAMVPHLRKIPLWKSLLIGSEITDESFILASNRFTNGSSVNPFWMFGANTSLHFTWITGTIIGLLLSNILSNTKSLGIDYALIGVFAALMILQIVNHKQIRIAIIVSIIGASIAIIGQLFITSSWAIIAATLIAASIGLIFEKS